MFWFGLLFVVWLMRRHWGRCCPVLFCSNVTLANWFQLPPCFLLHTARCNCTLSIAQRALQTSHSSTVTVHCTLRKTPHHTAQSANWTLHTKQFTTQHKLHSEHCTQKTAHSTNCTKCTLNTALGRARKWNRPSGLLLVIIWSFVAAIVYQWPQE